MTNRLLTSIVLIVFASFLAGCASSRLAHDQRSAIKRVAIAKVEMPDKPTIFGESAAGAFLLAGPLGLALANGTSDLPTEFSKALVRSRTDVMAILHSDLRKGLANQGFEVVPEGDARVDAVVVPKVIQYGLTGNIFATPPVRVPAFWVRLDLKRPATGETLWWNFASVHVSEKIVNSLEAKPIADYLTQPEMLDAQFRKASDLVTTEVLSKM